MYETRLSMCRGKERCKQRVVALIIFSVTRNWQLNLSLLFQLSKLENKLNQYANHAHYSSKHWRIYWTWFLIVTYRWLETNYKFGGLLLTVAPDNIPRVQFRRERRRGKQWKDIVHIHRWWLDSLLVRARKGKKEKGLNPHSGKWTKPS